MYSDPQTITVNAVAKVMARILTSGQSSTYQTADGLFKLILSHQLSNSRVRTMARFEQRLIVPDPLTSVNDWETLSTYHVIDRPEVGFSVAQIQQQIAGFQVWHDATSIAKLVGQES